MEDNFQSYDAVAGGGGDLYSLRDVVGDPATSKANMIPLGNFYPPCRKCSISVLSELHGYDFQMLMELHISNFKALYPKYILRCISENFKEYRHRALSNIYSQTCVQIA